MSLVAPVRYDCVHSYKCTIHIHSMASNQTAQTRKSPIPQAIEERWIDVTMEKGVCADRVGTYAA